MASNPTALLTVSSQGEILAWNDEAEQLFPLAPEPPLQRLEDLFLGTERERLSTLLQSSSSAVAPLIVERETPEGGIQRLEVQAQPLRSIQKSSAVTLLLREIPSPEHRSRPKTLEDNPAYLAAIVESSDDVIIGKDLDGIILSWNPAAERLYGYSRQEAVGQSVSILVPKEHPDEIPRIMERLRRGERIQHYETTRITKNGRRLCISLTISPVKDERGIIVGASTIARDITAQKEAEKRLQEEAQTVEIINRVGQSLTAELDLQRLLQTLTDAATELTGAQFGAFFYNIINELGEAYMLYTLSGVPKEAFSKFPMPRNTEIFHPTFAGEGVVRLDDVRQDPRYGKNEPYFGMPEGHLPVVSYLAVPVKSRSGEVLGGLFFGHSETGLFTERHERIVVGIAGQAAIAIDNARLYQQAVRAEKQVRQQLDFTTAITDNLGEGIFTLDEAGRITFINPAAERMLGWPEKELLGKEFHASFHHCRADGAPYPPEECPLLRVLSDGGSSFQEEETFIRRNGTLFPVFVNASPILTQEGHAGAVYSFQDITERKRTQEALQQSEQKFRAIFENTTEAILIADNDGVYLDANPAACELFGLPWEAMIGKTPADFSPPSLKETISESWAGFLEEGHQEGVFQLQRPDGTVLDLEYRARAHYLPGRHLSVLRDVTERQAMENALRDSEEQFRTLIEQSPLSVQILSPEGTILQVNRAWEELWGLKLEQVRDYNILQDQQLVEKGAMPFIRRGFEGEAVRVPPIVYDRGQSMPDLVKSQDPERWVRAYIYPIKDASGQIQKVVLIDEDFTDRIRLEEKLRQRAEELAEETARKDRFLAMLAHELRNPLAPILNAVHILRMRGGDDPSMQRAQDVVERQVHHMTRLIDELLDLSRITRGKIILQQKALKLSEVFEHAVQGVNPLIESRRHALSVSLPPEPLWVFADPDRLEQILTNLLNNAAKYTEPGGKIILSGAQEDGEIILRVKDTGIGIDREMLPHVFDLFAQADRSLDRSSGGLGIGLTLVKSLVQLHHGSVEAQSAGPGEGAEFVVRLPSAPARNTEVPVSPKATISPATESSLKVLVVEDNADGREMIRHLLELWGHEVELAENGPEGVQKAAAFQPDVALVDIGLPGLDGFGVAQRIRALANGNGITLIALSGYGRPEDRSQALDSGFDSYLTKPVDPEVLNRLLKK